jgi:luciferase family oxidoreductase group 1
MTSLSVLDLSPVRSGVPQAQALQDTLDLARFVDGMGFKRYWLAEHHAIPSVASSAPEVLIGHVASATEHLRVGSGGVMLPNHAPLRVVEEFKVLEALHPGRIDLGIGRAPGTDQLTALALRRSREALGADDFGEQLGELLGFGGVRPFPADHAFSRVHVVPDVPLPPVYLLGSSDYSAQAAAATGLGFAFAAHINPHGATDALRDYRAQFVASDHGFAHPHAILALSVVVGEDDEHAERLASSMRLSTVRLRSGRPIPLPTVEEAQAYVYDEHEEALLRGIRANGVVGGPEKVRARLEELIVAGAADEVMVMTHVHDPAERQASYARLADAMGLEPVRPQAALAR